MAMLPLLLLSCLALLESATAGYLAVPLQSPAGVTYVNSQQHVGLLAGPARLTQPVAATIVDARSAAVAVTPAPAPTYYSYNLPQQPVFGKASYTPSSVQYHTYSSGNPTVRVYEPKSFVYGVQTASSVPAPTTHTVHQHQVPVTVTTQYHHQPQTPTIVHHETPVARVPVPVHVPVHVPVALPVAPTYTKTVTTGPTVFVTSSPPPPPAVTVVKQVPVVRSRKYKVRRPAIQNQFYDIEERVIIRPVGSALVELEQPISQTETRTKTTTKTTVTEKRPVYNAPPPPPPPPPAPLPEVHSVAEEEEQEETIYKTRIGGPRVVTKTTTVYTERPPSVYQKSGYDRLETARAQGERTQVSAASTSKASDAEFIDASVAAAAAGQAESAQPERPVFTQGHAIYHHQQGHQTAYLNPFAPHLAPHPYLYHPANAGHLLHHVAYVDQHSPALYATHPGAAAAHHQTVFHVPSTTPLYPVTPARDCDGDNDPPKSSSEYLPPSSSVTPASPTTPSLPPVGTTTPYPPTSTPGQGSFADAEEEYDDSIVVNARSGATDGYSSTESDYDSTTVASVSTATPSYYHDKYRGESSNGQSDSQSRSEVQRQSQGSFEITYATRTTPASDLVAFDPSTASAGGFDLGPLHSIPRGFSFPSTTPRATTSSSAQLASSSASTAASQTTSSSSTAASQRSITIISSTTPRTVVSARFSDDSVSTSGQLSQSSSSSSQSVVVGEGLTREQIHANQEQFIKLLSERDSITQVGYDGVKPETAGSLLDTFVRSRVLSATPAPRDSKETSRTVNIRRIIVSRPVETEQEVEVREQAYHTTLAPPHTDSYEHKRDVSEVAGNDRLVPRVPVYVNAKPPAFANDSE
ncbi:mucin-2-like [Anopheles albimanus]|nr:mucin-2-like [Anopheles albimanus]XP_035780138.1 mucin-2-like [Anopheles albimanus]